jgi:hypothetical protein
MIMGVKSKFFLSVMLFGSFVNLCASSFGCSIEEEKTRNRMILAHCGPYGSDDFDTYVHNRVVYYSSTCPGYPFGSDNTQKIVVQGKDYYADPEDVCRDRMRVVRANGFVQSAANANENNI